MRLVALVWLSCVLLFTVPAAGDGAPPLEPREDAIEVSGPACLAPGVWVIAQRDGAGVLRIRQDGTTLDLGGATLRGARAGTAWDELHGVGILIEKAKGVTIRNGCVAGFKIGIRAVDAPGLVIEDVDASDNFRQRLGSTPEREEPTDWLWPHENDDGEWEARYGAGISLSDCAKARVRRCRVNAGQNGILLTRCTHCAVHDNDLSFNSGWGVGLYRTTHSEISHNRCDFCVRGYSHGVYHRGQDSAAILLFEQCSHNVIARNSATHSGDGLFLYAGHETTQRTGRGGSNFNRVLENDFSYAVANGIEATFSEGNEFVRNDCTGCDHGIWAGYSRRTRVLDCRVRDCRTAGISIEHGHGNTIAENDIRGSPYGVHLWWDRDPQFLEGAFGKNQDCFSYGNVIARNLIAGRHAAIRLVADEASLIVANRFPQDPARIELGEGAAPGAILANDVRGSLRIANESGGKIVLPGPAELQRGLVGEGDPVRFDLHQPVPAIPLLRAAAEIGDLSGSADVALPADLPRGRDAIRIDEWGPVDPRVTRLFPATVHAAGPEARFHLLGRGPFAVTNLTGGVAARPREGEAPVTLVVSAKGDGGPAFRPFHLEVSAGGETHAAEGSLLRMAWDVRFFSWTDAEDPVGKPEAFATLLAGVPKARIRTAALDWSWRAGGPEGVPSDHFATLATASAELPAGRFTLRVVSDDGVRVFANGDRVIERWDRHAPTEDHVVIEHGGGALDLRIEHFEIDGWAHLAFRLEPAER